MGFGLLALGLGSLEIVLDEGQRNDWFGSNFIVAFAAITVFCLVGVVVWELRQKQPVIDFHVLKERNFALATLSMLVLGFVLYGSTTLLPLFLQTLLGYTAMLSGMVLSPGGIAICICMPLVGFLLRKYQARWLVIFGVTISVLGLMRMSHFTLDVDYRHRGLGAGRAEHRGWPFFSFPSAPWPFPRFRGNAPTTPPASLTWRAISAAVRESPPSLLCWRGARSFTSRCWYRT